WILFIFFFFNDTATTEIYTLSLHDALPISRRSTAQTARWPWSIARAGPTRDRKSTRLNSSHDQISYAVFCLKKKKHTQDGICEVLKMIMKPIFYQKTERN